LADEANAVVKETESSAARSPGCSEWSRQFSTTPDGGSRLSATGRTRTCNLLIRSSAPGGRSCPATGVNDDGRKSPSRPPSHEEGAHARVRSSIAHRGGLRAEIDEVFAASGDLAGAVEQVARLGARLLLQAAVEAEVTTFLGRVR